MADDSKLMAAISYVWIIGVLMYFTKKEDAYVRFHAVQSILFGIAASIVISVTVFVLIGFLLIPVYFLAILFLAYKAYNGEKYMLPVLGEMAEKYASA
ncbi:DUF4870 domain-containing protein [Candidatus Micrarchaeota archaeon]|nr:DUF4870 domain-containing protein [Candidatus Micrarchaeota archaeon]